MGRQDDAYADAQALFFLKELFRVDSLTPLYDVFMRINLELWEDAHL